MQKRVLAVVLSLALPVAASAQGLAIDMHQSIGNVENKIMALAKAIPESNYAWRPTGARTVGEVLQHVAADNYLIPIAFGAAAPASTGIVGTDYKTVQAYEQRKLTKDQVIAELDASFKHLHKTFPSADTNLGDSMKFFGQDYTRRRAMLDTVTHLYEHLGQLIAYARSNNIVPPWSRGG